MGRYTYAAGPLLNTHERWYPERIAEAIDGLGHRRALLSHRDAGLLDLQSPAAQPLVFHDDIAALGTCVALLTGPDQDLGTSAEPGATHVQGKPCFGITDNFRFLRIMLWGICGEGRRIPKDRRWSRC
jgi:nucleoside 2-deoxyribosyltransferase